MENNELLMNLIKKLDSGEIIFNGDWVVEGKNKIRLCLKQNDNEPVLGVVIGEAFCSEKHKYDGIAFERKYDENWNREFKENFYREKGVKCWVKNCSNKILQKEGDYKKIKVACQEKHTRMVCLNCAEADAIEKLAEGEEDEE